MHKLVILTPDAEEFRTLIAGALPDLQIAIPDGQGPAEASSAVREADLLLAWKFPPGLLAEAPKLRWVQSFGAGVDHLMAADIPDGVTITRVVDVFGPAMAEYVVGYSYATTLGTRRFLEQQQRAEWKPSGFPLLRGKTAVVVGLGSIGREVCRLLAANGVRVVGVSRSGQAVAEVERTFAVEHLERALPEADLLVLVLPLTAASRGLIDARKLGLLPPGAWLINVARGPIVVEGDLLAGLRAGRPVGAVLDVFEQEPLPPQHPFWTMDNVLVTPHISGPDDNPRVAAQFVENYRRFRAGQPLHGIVDRVRGY